MTVDPATYRQVMSRLATGVTVLTTRDGDQHAAMTASAVMSVSLSPVLLVASVRHGSRWAAAARRSGSFAVSVLSERQEQLSRWCASSERHREPEAVHRHRSTTTSSGLLVFDDALASFECTVYDRYLLGDHELFAGEVVDMRVKDSGAPLLYFDSQYASLASPRTDFVPPINADFAATA